MAYDEHGITKQNVFGFIDLVAVGNTCHAFHRWRVKSLEGYSVGGVSPKEKECEPAKELHDSYRPECRRSIAEKPYDPGRFLLASLFPAVVFIVDLRRPFLNLYKRIDDANKQNGGSDVERPYDGGGYDTVRGRVLKSYPSQ